MKTSKFDLLKDLLIVILWLILSTISILVIKLTESLYFKILAYILLTVLSLMGLIVIILNIMALILNLIYRQKLGQSLPKVIEMTQQFEQQFLTSDFDKWQQIKSYWSLKLEEPFFTKYSFYFIDLLNANEDIPLISRFLLFWKEIQNKVNIIVEVMNYVQWDESIVCAQNRLVFIKELRELDNILRESDYLTKRFKFIPISTVIEKHRRQKNDLFRNAVIPENRKNCYVLNAIQKSFSSFEENLMNRIQNT